MSAANEIDAWKQKYFNSLDSLEKERNQFRAIEAALKRLTGRLCVASLGQSAQLDAELKKLQNTLRREATNDELDKIGATLTDAIGKLDQTNSNAPPSSVASAPTIVDERLRATLAALLAELRRDPELIVNADEVDGKLTSQLTHEQLPEVVAAVAQLVTRRIGRIERAKQEMEGLLSHMVSKLDEIGRFVADQNQSHTQSLAHSESLNTQLTGEMKAIGETIETADLHEIRSQVRNRIDSIGRHLQGFREREAARIEAMRASNTAMRARVDELEAKAKHLHDQLKDEQRLAAVDALTNVPNRLAYEKRIEEELQRFNRFKQPTCIAVWDIDRFKSINDSYGHRAGDKVLRAVAESLAARIRSTDFLARLGGEEFIMLLCGTKLEDGLRLVDEVRETIAKLKFHHQGTPLPVTISSGITALVANDTAAAAFDRADKALYKAKEGGRNRCVSA